MMDIDYEKRFDSQNLEIGNYLFIVLNIRNLIADTQQ